MKLVKKILGRLSGLKYPQEYLCLARESFEQPLLMYLVIDGKVVEDITKHHNFVGYSPVIFALSSAQTAFFQPEEITVAFTAKTLPPNEKFFKKDAVATLTMKKIKEQSANGETVLYFEG